MLTSDAIDQEKRTPRVRFRHPVRVVTLDGQPRVIRTLTSNVSHKGMFVRMPEPLPTGTRVALSLEAGGRALALAQAEVVWQRHHEGPIDGRHAGCGVRFTGYLHPRADELVKYLVENLDRGKPLRVAPPETSFPKWPFIAGSLALVILGLVTAIVFAPSSPPSPPEEERVGVRSEPVEAPTPLPPPPVEAKPPTPEPEPAPAPEPEPVAVAPEPVEAAPAPAVPPAPEVVPEAPAPKGTLLPPTLSSPGGEGDIGIPTGATDKLSWRLDGTTLHLTANAPLERAFVLNDPPRAVLDLQGPPPKRSHQLDAHFPHATAVRVGKLPHGTRLVVDLDALPKKNRTEAGALILGY